MFKFLKEKIKKWIKKTNSSAENVKQKKSKKKGQKKEEKKKKEEPKKSGPKEKISGEKPRFSFFKKRFTEEKFEESFEELEIVLLQNNVALEVVEEIKRFLKKQLIGKNLSDVNLGEALKKSLKNILISSPNFLKEIKGTLAVKSPFVIIFVGINGSGKTTTIAKIAHLLKKEKFSCVLAAADTFRAASIEQLQEHADNLNVPLIKKDYGTDPASVGFDAINYAKKHNIDVVLIDTAGRMHTKDSLMKEMGKIARVNKADMKIFVGESITGNDATKQAAAFHEAINLTGIILSKVDVDEKGGTAISVSHVTKKPILFLGTGQKYDSLEVFNKDKILKNLGL